MKTKKIVLLCILIFNSKTASSKTVDADKYFIKWVQTQHVLNKVNLCEMKKGLTLNQLQDLKNKYNLHLHFLKTLITFFNLDSNKKFEEILFKDQLKNDYDLRNRIYNLYDLIQNDFQGFIQNLKEKRFDESGIHSEENQIELDILVSKYWTIFNLLFTHQDPFKAEKMFFALGNKTFEYCFSPKTFKQFKELILNKNYHSIARLLLFFIWKPLISLGWNCWHQDILDAIKKVTDTGGQMLYIAGGCDIYTPIKHGIYNIKIIDPMLPTQDQYYTQEWKWLIEPELSDGKKDKIEFFFDERKITLKKIEHKITGQFIAKYKDKEIIQLPESTTTWQVIGPENQEVGKVIYERRPTKQEDFTANKNIAIVMSLNEQITAIEAPKITHSELINYGWGINPNRFDNNLQVYIKQIKTPISKQVLQNLKWASSQANKLAFIKLSSDQTE